MPDRALFELEQPLIVSTGGQQIEVNGIGMREFGRDDLPLLDRFIGQPVELARNVIAALCDLTVDQVCQLSLDDFTMLASDALYQVERVSLAMGLPRCHFLQPQPESQPAAAS